jgi:hypothetical protein
MSRDNLFQAAGNGFAAGLWAMFFKWLWKRQARSTARRTALGLPSLAHRLGYHTARLVTSLLH